MDSAALTLTYLACGVLGGFAKAYLTPEQFTFSRRTISDVVAAGVVGALGPKLGLIPIPEGWNLIQQGVLVAGICYASADVFTGVLAKIGIAPSPADRRQ